MGQSQMGQIQGGQSPMDGYLGGRFNGRGFR